MGETGKYPDGREERVLVVEDHEDVREVVMTQLRELNYQPVEARDGATALVCLAKAPLNLLFTDVILPGGMDGVALAEAARKQQKDLKVLFTSGYIAAAIRDRIPVQAHVLEKPYSRDELAKTLREALEQDVA